MQFNEEQKRVSEVAKFLSLFLGADGEFALEQMDMLCGYSEDVFSKDPYKNAYNSGRRSVSVDIHKMLKLSLEKGK